MVKNNPVANLQKLIDVNIPIIYIDDYDFARIDEIILQACGKKSKIKEWNPASGYTKFNTKEIVGPSYVGLRDFLKEQYAANIGAFPDNKVTYLVLREISGEIENPEIMSLLTHISQRKLYDRKYDVTIIISDYGLTLPQQLLPYVSILNIDIPDDSEIERLINEHINENDFNPDKFTAESKAALMPSLRGLSLFEIDRVLDMAMSVNGTLGAEDKEMILNQKKAQVRKSGLLDLINVKERPQDIGGLKKLKRYLEDKSQIMRHLHEAQDNKIATPKGVFIVGMPGCGKSLCAKAAAAQFDNCPLLKLDMGSMMGKYVGQSESNLRRAIRIAEAAAPCILWIDEIEKGFSGVGGNNDIMTRMFGYFLSWMQDKTSSVYVIATANNADNLPPELKRKGRFDEIFCVNLPTREEREAIINVHLRKRGQEISSLNRVLEKTNGFNGADIESMINEALEDLFIESLKKRKDGDPIPKIVLTEDKLLEVAKRTISISKSCKKQIEDMEAVFKESNFTNASE
jgi:AAA+ superfamily predicted ATPase